MPEITTKNGLRGSRRIRLFTDKGKEMEVFQDYAYYYNAFYNNKNYAAEAGQIDMLLKRYKGVTCEKIINYGCGTGKHDIELSMQEQLSIRFVVADVRSYEPKEKYDAVISMFHVMSYQNRNEDLLAALKSARKALDKSGLFIFDAWYGPGVLTDKPVVRVKELETADNKLVRVAKPVMHDQTNIVDVCYEVLVINKETNETKVINEIHNMRYFFRPELEFYLREAGFELLDNLDCMTLGKTSYDSWTSYFIAKAI